MTTFIWDIAPEVFSFSPLPRWYGLFFASGVMGGYLLARKLLTRDGLGAEDVDRLFMNVVLGTIIGMRLAHCLFYEPEVYLREPLRILKIWEGGFASHGGFFGVIVAILLFARRHKNYGFLRLADRVAVASMIPAAFIRLGNFFNSEMIGHPTDMPWAVVFKRYSDELPRHPTQLYEAFGYAAIAVIGCWLMAKTPLSKTAGRVFGFVLCFGMSWRIFIETFKENQAAFEANMSLNMGQLLSVPFVLVGIYLLVRRRPLRS